MFSLRDYLDYKAKEQAFKDIRLRKAEQLEKTPRMPYLGMLQEIKTVPEKSCPPVNDVSKPITYINTNAPPLIHIKPSQEPQPKVEYLNRIGIIRKLK